MARKKRITKKVLFAKTVEIMQPVLGLQDWKLIVRYSTRMKDTADCEASPEYKEAIIRINMNDLKGLGYNDIVATAIHEMLHCVVWPLAAWAENLTKTEQQMDICEQQEESLVTNLEKIMVPLASDLIQTELKACGYSNIDLEFVQLDVAHEH